MNKRLFLKLLLVLTIGISVPSVAVAATAGDDGSDPYGPVEGIVATGFIVDVVFESLCKELSEHLKLLSETLMNRHKAFVELSKVCVDKTKLFAQMINTSDENLELIVKTAKMSGELFDSIETLSTPSLGPSASKVSRAIARLIVRAEHVFVLMYKAAEQAYPDRATAFEAVNQWIKTRFEKLHAALKKIDSLREVSKDDLLEMVEVMPSGDDIDRFVSAQSFSHEIIELLQEIATDPAIAADKRVVFQTLADVLKEEVATMRRAAGRARHDDDDTGAGGSDDGAVVGGKRRH